MKCSQLRNYSLLGRGGGSRPSGGNSQGPFNSLALEGSSFPGWGSHIWCHHPWGMCDNRPGVGEFVFQASPSKLAVAHCARWGSLLLPPCVFGFRTEPLESRGNNNKNDENRQSNEHHKVCARQHGPCAPRGVGALGIPTRRPRQKKRKAAWREVHLTVGEQHHRQYCLAKKKKKLLKRKIKREQHKQLYDAWAQAQNWPALLGSHCRRRTMDGSLLAPRMNSSRESLPSLLVSIWRKIFSVLFSGVDSSSGIFMTEETIL